jgi:hypothetical protein
MSRRLIAALALGGATFLGTSTAIAVEPAELKQGASVAGLIGFGASSYGFDLGVRAGYTLPNNVYLGGTFIFNTGFGGWGSGFTTGFEGGYQFAAGPVVVRPYGGIGFADEQYNYYGYCGGAGPGNNGLLQSCLNACAQGAAVNLGTCDAACENAYGSGTAGYYNCGSTTSVAFWVGGTAMYDFKGGPWFVAADIRMGDAPALFGGNVIFAFLPGGGYEF